MNIILSHDTTNNGRLLTDELVEIDTDTVVEKAVIPRAGVSKKNNINGSDWIGSTTISNYFRAATTIILNQTDLKRGVVFSLDICEFLW